MTNRERAEGLVKKITENYEAFVPADMSPFREKEYDAFQADAIEQALDEAEARGRDEGRGDRGVCCWRLEKALRRVWNEGIAAGELKDQIAEALDYARALASADSAAASGEVNHAEEK